MLLVVQLCQVSISHAWLGIGSINICPGLRQRLAVLQVLLVVLHAAASHWLLCTAVGAKRSFLHKLERVYIGGFVALEADCAGLHFIVFGPNLPFLPLLLVSVYSALGVTHTWLCMASHWLVAKPSPQQSGHQKSC